MRKISVCFVLISLLVLGSINTKAQSGYEFWFGAPDLEDYYSRDYPIALIISTYDLPAQITISQPANAGFTPIVQNIAANQTVTVNLSPFIVDIETQYGDSAQNRGILIQSTEMITTYYENQNLVNREMYVLKGSNALGFEFFVPFQTWGDNGIGDSYSGFVIVATVDNTTVNITPTTDVYFSGSVTQPAGLTFSRIINAGQTYAVRALGKNAGDQLCGTHVISDHPIAITMTDDCLHSSDWGTCSDLIGDQIVPVEKSGDLYVIPLGKLYNSHERAVIQATMDNTSVILDGSVSPGPPLTAGQSYIIDLPVTPGSTSTTVQSSKSVNILHISGYGCEYGGAVVPPINGATVGSSSVAFARSCPNSELFAVMLICHTGSESSFIVNGNASIVAPGAFQAVPGTSGAWVEAYVDLSSYVTQGQACRINNSGGIFHCGVLCGGSGTGCGYGYFTQFYHAPAAVEDHGIPGNEDMYIYPNPSCGTVNIISRNDYNPADKYIAKIYNAQGKLIQETNLLFNGTYSHLSLYNATAGIYYLTILSDKRIVKQLKMVVY